MALYQCKHGATFDPSSGSCSACDAEPPDHDDVVPGEGERACAEAERRGMPDMLDAEARAWASQEFAHARKIRFCELADIWLSSMDPDDVDRGLKAEAIAAKWGDTEIKAEKLATGPVIIRERIAAADRADRAQTQKERSN